MRREGKETGFQGGTNFLKTINIQHVFTRYLQKYTLGKQNKIFQSKYIQLFEVLWTTSNKIRNRY